MIKDLYDTIQEQFPSVYEIDELYQIQHKLFNSSSSYFAAKNSRSTLRIFKLKKWNDKILIERFKFTKKKELKVDGDFILKPIDLEYDYFKKLLDNTKNICYNANCKE